MRYTKSRKIGSPIIVCDKQEKHPWPLGQWLNYPMVRKHLKVGDYSLKGLEDVFTVEKKADLCELLTDLSGKYRKTFERFLLKLSKYPIKCIIVEDELGNLPEAIKELKYKSGGACQPMEKTIYYWLARIVIDFNIPIIFAGRSALPGLLAEIFKFAQRKVVP